MNSLLTGHILSARILLTLLGGALGVFFSYTAAHGQSALAPTTDLLQASPPSDVLTPNDRSTSPDWKLGIKFGINRSAYSNDRYLDNRPLDVGNVFGETKIYGSASGFGYQTGLNLEIPRSTFFSWVFSLEYTHVRFGGSGPVDDRCFSEEGELLGTSSHHDFDASLDYLKLAGAAKLDFQRFYVLLGLTAARPLSSGVMFARTFEGERCYYPDPDDIRNNHEEVEIPETTSLHYALRLGGGLTYRLTDRLQFSPKIIFDFGSNPINKSPESDLGVYGINALFRYTL